MRKVLVGLTLAFLSSIAWVAWSVIADILLIGDKENYVTYLTVVYVFVLLLTTVIATFYIKKSGNKFKRKDFRLALYALAAGVVFGLGTIIFFGLLGNTSYPFVATVQVSAVVPYAFFITLIAKEKPRINYYIGTVIVLSGFVLQVLGIYGNDLSAAIPTILLAVSVLVFYTVGYLLSFYFVYNGLHPLKASPIVILASLATVLTYGLITNAYAHAGNTTGYGLLLSVFIAIAVVVGYTFEELPVNMLKRVGVKYLNLANLLSSFETPGILVFSALFLSLLYPPLIIGLLLTFAGIVLVVYS